MERMHRLNFKEMEVMEALELIPELYLEELPVEPEEKEVEMHNKLIKIK